LPFFNLLQIGMSARWRRSVENWLCTLTMLHLRRPTCHWLRSSRIGKQDGCGPISPGLAPWCFCLFGHIKRLLTGRYFQSADSLLSAIQTILTSPEKAFLLDVLLSGLEGWNNVAISPRTTLNHGNNHVFDLPVFWLDSGILMRT
jgi:hypothetical protein